MTREMTLAMIEDFRPYVKDPSAFARWVGDHVKVCGEIIRVEKTVDASGNVIEKRYYTDDSDTPDFELNAIRAGVESLEIPHY